MKITERRPRGILFSLMSIISIIVVVISIIFTVILVQYRTNDIIESADSRLMYAAELTREILGAGYHDSLLNETSMSKEQFDRIVARNDDICRRLNIQYLWSVLLVKDRLVFTSATHSDLNNPDSPCASFFETHNDPGSFASAMQPDQKPSFSSFRNEWGEGRMVLIPHKDSQGRTYIFGASVQLTELNTIVRKSVTNSAGIGLGILCLSFIFSLVMVRSFTRPIARLTEAAVRMAKGDLDVPLVKAGTREIQSLSNSLDQMRQGLKHHLAVQHENEGKYRILLEESPDPIFSFTPEARYIYVNRAFAKGVGKNIEDIIGKNIRDVFSEDEAEKRFKPLKQVFQTGEGNVIEVRVPNKEGDLFFVTTITPIKDTEGKVVSAICSSKNITARKRTEDELQKSSMMLQLILDTIPQFICWKDKDLRFLGCNQNYSVMAGLPNPQAIIGKTDWDLPWAKEESEFFTTVDRRIMEADKAEYHIIEPAMDANGRQTWLDTNKVPLHDKDGNVSGILVSFEDITERKNAEEEKAKLEAQLQQAQKIESVGRLAGGVAHDFNNILTVIMTNSDMALISIDRGHSVKDEIKEIRKAAERASDLTSQLLAFARKQTIAPRILNLNDTIAGMLKMLGRLIGEDIDLVWKPGDDLWPIKMDTSQVDQILANLSVNARDAISGVGNLSIETKNVILDENLLFKPPGVYSRRLCHAGSERYRIRYG